MRLFLFAGVGAGAGTDEDEVLSERVAISSAISSGVSGSCLADGAASPSAAAAAAVVVVAAANALVFVSTRGTSTKSAVSDRGELSGEERTSEEDKDQTISSSSEVESLAHLVLEVSESISSDDDKEVVMVYCEEDERDEEMTTVVNDDRDYLCGDHK